MTPSFFPSFFLGGFECSTHRNIAGRRLDLIAGTRHDLLAAEDFSQLAEHGMRAARDGVRWHLIETSPGRYDWSAVLPLMRAAEAAGVHVAWDICHYGWPDELDVFSVSFVERLARYAAAFARLHLEETGRAPVLCPVNEISFLAWGGGDMKRMTPHQEGRGPELKVQLVRAAIAATWAAREAVPGTRFVCAEPVIHISPRFKEEAQAVADYNGAQFEAMDMLTGRLRPELGGAPELLDLVGVNYYWNNQWVNGGEPISPFDMARARPFSGMLAEVQARYGKPLFLAETSIEGWPRASWLRHVCDEVRDAMKAGVAVEGICLYPVLSHMGWDEDRYCDNGLFELAPKHGRRQVHQPLAEELRRQQCEFSRFFATMAQGQGRAQGQSKLA